MIFSFFEKIPSGKRAACLLNQATVAEVTQIDDRIAAVLEQSLNLFPCAGVICRNKCNSSRPVEDWFRLQIRREHMIKRFDHSRSRGKPRDELAGGQVSNICGREFSGLAVKRIGPINQNLISPPGKTGKCLRYVV